MLYDKQWLEAAHERVMEHVRQIISRGDKQTPQSKIEGLQWDYEPSGIAGKSNAELGD